MLRIPARGPWRVRVVPNRYPALAGEDGAQEVVIHAAEHVTELARLDTAQLERVAGAWGARAEARRREGWAHLLATVNEGAGSGASIDHSHSQLTALARLPDLTARRWRRFARRATCPLCRELEQLDPGLVIATSGGVVAYAPPASLATYHLRAAPLVHAPDGFGAPRGVAQALGLIAGAIGGLRGGAAWNAWLETAPLKDTSAAFHWHVEAIPRVTVPGAIELGAGLPICAVDPAEAAAELRF